MKYCQKCGKELMDEAVICPCCGCAVAAEAYKMQREATETGALATTALVFAFISPIVGIILGIIGTAKYTTKKYKDRSTAAIIASIGIFVACFSLIMAVSIY